MNDRDTRFGSYFRASIFIGAREVEAEYYWHPLPAIDTAEAFWQDYRGCGGPVTIRVDEFSRTSGPSLVIWYRAESPTEEVAQ